jgi:tellurite resistance protein
MSLKKLVTLISVPIRLSGAGLLVLLAYQLPYVMLALLVLILVAACGGLILSILARRAVRMRLRTRCVVCDAMPLKIARICPQCHTPLLAATVRELPPHVCQAVIQSATALAWASGDISPAERGYLLALLKVARVEDDQRQQLQDQIAGGLSLGDLKLPPLTRDESQQVLQAAAALVTVDGSLLPAEATAYNQLAAKLGIAPASAKTTLADYLKLAWI